MGLREQLRGLGHVVGQTEVGRVPEEEVVPEGVEAVMINNGMKGVLFFSLFVRIESLDWAGDKLG